MPNKSSWITLIALAVYFPGALPASSYGYAEAEDPVVAIFRDAVAEARNNDFTKASAKALEGLKTISAHHHNGAALAPKINMAAEEKNAPMMAEILANIVYLSLKEKLEVNISENLKNFKQCKARLFLARKNYLDVLDGNLKKHRPQDAKKILGWFDDAMTALGNPGLFGVGSKPSDPAAFKRAARNIEKAIEQFYTRFEAK